MSDSTILPDFSIQTIVEEANDGIIIVANISDTEDAIDAVFANRAMEKMSGYSRQQLLANPSPTILGTKTTLATSRQIKQHLVSKTPFQCRLLSSGKSGEDYWVEQSIIPISNPLGVITHMAAVQRDITQFIQLETALGGIISPCHHDLPSELQAFQQALDREWHRANRHHTTFTVLSVRLQPPSRQTVPANEHLASISCLLQNQFRKEDTIKCINSLEYAALLPETDRVLANSVINRLQSSLTKVIELRGYTMATGLAELELLDQQASVVLERAQTQMQKNRHLHID